MKKYYILLTVILSFYEAYGEENFILISGSTNEVIREYGSNLGDRVTPASSFKIVLSLMGYDTGILENEHIPVWNFQEGYDDFLEAWKCPNTPQTWMTDSCIWFSKIIACKLGIETIKKYLNLFNYGNQDFSTGMIPPGPTNPAWVSASLKISPKEQVEFIQKLVQGKFPISAHAQQMTKNLLFKEEIALGWKLFGKPGMGSNKELKVRWFVGWLENDHIFFPFAYLLLENEVDVLQTIPRVKELLLNTLTEIN